MKFIGKSKFNDKSGFKRVQNIILNDDPQKHFVTAFFNTQCIQLSDVIFNEDMIDFLHIETINELSWVVLWLMGPEDAIVGA